MWNKRQYQFTTLPILLLELLSEEDRSGLQLVYKIREKTGGSYTAGLGSLFALLHPLESEGYISSSTPKGRTPYYHIEASGRKYLSQIKQEYSTLNEGMQLALTHSGTGVN